MKPGRRSIGAWGVVAAFCAAFAMPVSAQSPEAVRSMASTCFTCHGTDGRSVGGVPPSLAGQDRNYLLQQMMEFKAGKRAATIMHQHAKGYTDRQLELIADYFSKIKPGPAAAAPASRGGY